MTTAKFLKKWSRDPDHAN